MERNAAATVWQSVPEKTYKWNIAANAEMVLAL